MAIVNFEPEILSSYFKQITECRHTSGKEDEVRSWVISSVHSIIAKYPEDNRKNISIVEYNPEETEDKAVNPGLRNIFLRRGGGSKFSGMSPVILQAHMDMVTVPSDDIFPLNLRIYDDGINKWLKADNTTLGADDGIGVAAILSVLEDEELKDIPVECLFTVQEETDMGGAYNFDIKLFTGEKYINLDAEDLNVITFGSAGGCSSKYTGKICYSTETQKDFKTFKLTVEKLKSGHSGVDINKYRLNAIKVISDVLARLDNRLSNVGSDESISSYDLMINDIKRSDIVKSNSIPASCTAVVSVPSESADDFCRDVNVLLNTIKQRSQPIEDTFTWNVEKISDPENLKSMSRAFTDSLLNLLNQLPNGVIKMIDQNPGTVETSSNLYDISITGDEISVFSSNRSSNDNSFECLNNIQKNIGVCHGFSTETNIDRYPAWQPDYDSSLLAIADAVYRKKFKNTAEKNVIHAGLECSWIIDKYKSLGKNMECISIGPTIQNPHTENERLLLESGGEPMVALHYEALKEIIKGIFR
jgi:dipeptidase D